MAFVRARASELSTWLMLLAAAAAVAVFLFHDRHWMFLVHGATFTALSQIPDRMFAEFLKSFVTVRAVQVPARAYEETLARHIDPVIAAVGETKVSMFDNLVAAAEKAAHDAFLAAVNDMPEPYKTMGQTVIKLADDPSPANVRSTIASLFTVAEAFMSQMAMNQTAEPTGQSPSSAAPAPSPMPDAVAKVFTESGQNPNRLQPQENP